MNLKVKETWRNLLVIISTRQKKIQKEKHIFVSFPFNTCFQKNIKGKCQFKEIHRSTFQLIIDISIVFLWRIWRKSMRKHCKCLYRISSFYEKRIDTSESEHCKQRSKHFQINRNLSLFVNWKLEETCLNFPVWKLISPCYRRVKSVPSGLVELSSWQNRII